jgi:type II secretion system protein C
VAEPDEFSFALIAQEGPEAPAMSYGIGDALADAVIARIEPRQVVLRKPDGTEEILTMAKDQVAQGGGPRPPVEPRPPTEGAVEGITELGENKYAIDRSVVDKYLGDMTALSSMARAIPHRGPDGEIDGYRLSGIRRTSPLSQLGIKNGDVVHTVNGQSLTTLTDAMSAFQSLQSQSSFAFDVTRRGQKQTMEYQVR